jgi:flagellar assembly protein FliH
MSTYTAKFVFDNDFSRNRQAKLGEADIAQANQTGFERGVMEGRAAAQAEIAAAYASAAQMLAHQLSSLLADADARTDAIEMAAMDVAVTLARSIAGAALADRPDADLQAAARAALGHARGQPHLAVRVNEATVTEMDQLMQRLSRETGFSGRVIVLGEPDIAPGEGRIEWADGGILIDRAALDASINQAVATALGRPATGHH